MALLDDAIAQLASNLITSLDLSSKDIDENGAKRLAAVLKNNKSLNKAVLNALPFGGLKNEALTVLLLVAKLYIDMSNI